MSRTEQLRMRAKRVGLRVDTYAPGDGIRRYQFMVPDARGNGGAMFKRHTAMGLKAAEEWLDGFVQGYDDGYNKGYDTGRKVGV